MLGVLVVYSLASYAFAVLDFPGRRFLFWFFVALLFVPGITVLLPLVILENELGILGTHLGLILPFVNGTAPLTRAAADQRVPRRSRASCATPPGSTAPARRASSGGSTCR